MTRAELIDILAVKLPHVQYQVVEESVKHLFERMAEALAKGKRIEVRGFGSFAVRFRPPRTARNPKTGDQVTTEGKYTPRFKAGKELRERVNAAREAGVPIQETE